ALDGYLRVSLAIDSSTFHFLFIGAQNARAKNATMPILSLPDNAVSSGVLANAPALAGLPAFANRLLPLEQAHNLYPRAREGRAHSVLENLLREMNIDLQLNPADFERIPEKGPVVVVANHPYGLLDGAVLAVVLKRARADVKVMTNFLLASVPEL